MIKMKIKPCLSMKQLSSRALFRGELVSCSSRLHAVSHILHLQHTSLNMPRLQMKYYLKNNFFQHLPSSAPHANLDWGGSNTSTAPSPSVFLPIKAKPTSIISLVLTQWPSKSNKDLAKQIISSRKHLWQGNFHPPALASWQVGWKQLCLHGRYV